MNDNGYIDRKELILRIFELYKSKQWEHDSKEYYIGLSDVVEVIRVMPKADVKEINRCRMCEYFDDNFCWEYQVNCSSEREFCVNGKRKEQP